MSSQERVTGKNKRRKARGGLRKEASKQRASAIKSVGMSGMEMRRGRELTFDQPITTRKKGGGKSDGIKEGTQTTCICTFTH